MRVRLARARDPESFNRHALVGPAQHWRAMRKFQITFLRQQGLKPSDTFLDLGCGTLRGGIPVIEFLDADRYVGLDVREEALAEARAELERYKLTDKHPDLLDSSDFGTLHTDKRFDKAWAFAVLIHMPDEVVTRAFQWVGAHVKPEGVYFADVRLGDRHDAERQEGFPVLVTRPLEFYAELGAAAGFGKVDDLGTIWSLGHRTGMPGDKRHMLRFTR
jgi:cyclopropane fatty-acyl-phospholipid synthase-like methyltransferase